MTEVIVATRNQDKSSSFRNLCSKSVSVLDLNDRPDITVRHSKSNDVRRASFVKAESAFLTPHGFTRHAIVVTESSGLFIPKLQTQSPGRRIKECVGFSPRVMNTLPDGNARKAYLIQAEQKLLKLLEGLTDIEDREATLISVVTVLVPDGTYTSVECTLQGFLTKAPRTDIFKHGIPCSRIFLPIEEDGVPMEKVLGDIPTERLDLLLPRGQTFIRAAEIVEAIVHAD